MKQPTIHFNTLSKTELKEFYKTIDEIKSGKIKYNAEEKNCTDPKKCADTNVYVMNQKRMSRPERF